MRLILLALALAITPLRAENVNPKVFSFKTISPPTGTNPVASTPTDTLYFTSSDDTISIGGNSSTKTIDFKLPASGAVTSVGLKTDSSTSSIFANTTNNVTGSPITSSGNFTLTLSSQSPHVFLGGPTSGVAAVPAFRTLVASDIPTLNQNTTGTAANVSGVVAIAHGGTNSSTALNSNRFMVSSGGAVVEASAVTASRALASDSNGLPVAATTTATELGYVNGVTSAIQTQMNAKAPLASPVFSGTIGTALTASKWVKTDGSGNLTTSSLVEEINGQIETPGNKDYSIVPSAAYGRTINAIYIQCSTGGTITASLSVNGGAVTGCSALSVTSSTGSFNCTAANSVSAADPVTLSLSSNSTCTDLIFTVKTTR